MIITQVHLVLGTIKVHSYVTQHNVIDVSSLRQRAIGMLTTGMSTRAVARYLNVNFSTISHLQRLFWEFGSTSNQPQKPQTMCKHASTGPHPASSPAESSETSHPDSWWNWGVFLSVIKPFCGEKLILIGWAWLHSGWAWLLSGWLRPFPVMWNP